MTNDQWWSIQADIAAIKVLLLALARTHPDQRALGDDFEQCRELLHTVSLNSGLPEAAFELQTTKIDSLKKAFL